jgi:hypothetical protein
LFFQGINEEQEFSARSSFPSGHASQAAFAAIFLVLFAQVISQNSDSKHGTCHKYVTCTVESIGVVKWFIGCNECIFSVSEGDIHHGNKYPRSSDIWAVTCDWKWWSSSAINQ